jgi:integrase
MARPKAGERVYGPYQHHAKWRVIHVHPGVVGGEPGRRAPRQVETEAEGTVTVVTREQGDRTIFEIDRPGYAQSLARSIKKKIGTGVRTAGEAFDLYLQDLREDGHSEKDVEHKQDSFALFLERQMLLTELGDAVRCQAIYDHVRRRAQPRTVLRCARLAAARGVAPWPKHGIGELKGCVCEAYAADTHRNALGEVKTFLRFCVARRWLKASGFEGVKGKGKRRKGHDAKPQLTVDEARRFIKVCFAAAALGDQGAVAALMTLLMGLRRAEINSRTVRDVDMGGARLWVVGKGGKRRYLKIIEDLRPLILQLCAGKAPTASLWDYSRNGSGTGRVTGRILGALRDAAPAVLTPAEIAARTGVGLDTVYVMASKLARAGTIGRGEKKGQYRHLDITPTPLELRRPTRRSAGVPSAGWIRKAVQRLCTEAGVMVVTAHANRGLNMTLKTIGGLDELLKQIALEAGHGSDQVSRDHYIQGQALADAGQNAALAALGLGPGGDLKTAIPSGNETRPIVPGADHGKAVMS